LKNKLCFILCQDKAFEELVKVTVLIANVYLSTCGSLYNKHKTDIIKICISFGITRLNFGIDFVHVEVTESYEVCRLISCSAAYRETELIFTEVFGFLGYIEKAVVNKLEEETPLGFTCM
jgi:hypothetical protein